MNNLAIRVENLSKLYKIGRERHDTLRDHLAHRFKSVFSRNCNSSDSAASDFWALKDVSFEVKQGEVVGIVGRNGAGKSTLLKILSRITQPTKGRGEIYGRVGSLLEVGTGFHPELTGRENIYLNGAMLGMTKVEINTKFDEIVGFAEFSKFIDTPVKRYSSGMYMRLAFAVAAHLESEILIIDEVLAVGDIAFQKKCLAKMSDVAKAGRTVLFVSHNMGSLRRLCSRSLWLDDGQIRMSGDTPGTIAAYVAASEPGSKSASVFPLDLTKKSQLRSAKILNHEGGETRAFQCDEPVRIEITYQVHREVPGLYAYMAILGEAGMEVLISDSRDSVPNPFDDLCVGEHTIFITIPARTLGHGDYQVYFDTDSIFSHNRNVDAPGIIGGFHLDDDSSLRGNRRGGVFSTLLDWRTATPVPADTRELRRV